MSKKKSLKQMWLRLTYEPYISAIEISSSVLRIKLIFQARLSDRSVCHTFRSGLLRISQTVKHQQVGTKLVSVFIITLYIVPTQNALNSQESLVLILALTIYRCR